MLPADQALVQKCLSATLAKVSAMKKNLAGARHTLQQQEQALYEATSPPVKQALSGPKSPSILDGDVDMQDINDAIKRLTKSCACPNLQNLPLPPTQQET